MDWFQKIGEGTGALAGGVIGGAFNLAAELTHAQLLQEAGAEVFQGNKNAGKYAGQTLDGVIDTASGFFTKMTTNCIKEKKSWRMLRVLL